MPITTKAAAAAAKEKKEIKETRRESKMSRELSVDEAEADIKEGTLEKEFRKFREHMQGMFKDLEDSLGQRIGKLDKKFSNMFLELKTEIGSLKSDVQAAVADVDSLTDRMDEYEKSLEFQSESQTALEKKHDKELSEVQRSLDEKIKLLDQKLMLAEKQDRKYNLLFYGIAEQQGERLYEKMRHFFVSDLGIDEQRAQNIHFVHGHRYPTESEGPNPVILRFSCYEDRELILSGAKNLLKTGKRILIDLPVSMKKERGRIAKIAYNIRKTEKLQTRIKDKGLELYLEVRKDSHDRWVKRQIEASEGSKD